MITLYDFNGFDEHRKGEAVFIRGTVIDDGAEANYNIQLYLLDWFYVEVYYDPQKNSVERYHAFISPGKLGFYIRLS
jgi:hypothetical protein